MQRSVYAEILLVIHFYARNNFPIKRFPLTSFDSRKRQSQAEHTSLEFYLLVANGSEFLRAFGKVLCDCEHLLSHLR